MDDYRARTYTFADLRLVSMFARLEGAPATAEEVLRDLDGQGKLSPPTDHPGAVEVIERYARHDDQCRSQRVLGQGPCNCGYEAARAAVFGGR